MRSLRKHASLYLMILPALLFFVVFTYYPLVLGVDISLQDFHIIGTRAFVGLQNYVTVLTDPTFWAVLQNTVILGAGILVLGFIAPIVVALSLNEVIHTVAKKTAQMVIYIPHLFSWVVVGGIWIYLLSPDDGLVNIALQALGAHPINFLADGTWARLVMILTAVWKDVGFNCILYLAAIVGISPSLYEAARIDGANRWHQVRYVTLPQLVPTMKVVLMLMVMGVLRTFDQIYIMRNAAIEPKVDVLMTYVFDKGITEFQMGVASAASILVLIMTLALTMVVRKVIRYDED
ncbi:ABC transporter permease subunit [Alicyclobacillus macrosporangiidus]|uniref:ABC transporter permease subunit n=1 Tax=Alicyclobacillus macrosporangiidus TaxID=392015 RepID=UPI0004969305|nr:ABC transporter permease subunit [Alicyclobacillus macrosporangiidus]